MGLNHNFDSNPSLSLSFPRWRNWVIRGVFTFLMISGFGLIIYGGPLALMITVSG